MYLDQMKEIMIVAHTYLTTKMSCDRYAWKNSCMKDDEECVKGDKIKKNEFDMIGERSGLI